MAALEKLKNALFSPKSVALVGASEDLSKNNSKAQRFLTQHGYKGTIYPINLRLTEVMGIRSYPNLRALPELVEHAFIMTPAHAVPAVIDECCELGVPVATIFSSGFAELGEKGAKLQQQIVAKARASGLRMIGPNCIGVIDVHSSTMLSASGILAKGALKKGPLSVISQSGNVLGTLLSRSHARGLGFSKLVSIGNECDLGVGEIARMMIDDIETKAVLLFLETFRDPEQLALAARRAHLLGKPVIAYKLGRSDVGRQAAALHTGAMLGTDEAANAFFEAHGIMRVETIEALFECPQLVMGYKPPRGRRVAFVTGTGGGAAMVADRLGVLGVKVVPPSAQVIENLGSKHIHISDAPITDLPLGKSEGGVYTEILSEFLNSDHCDAVVAVIGSAAVTNPTTIGERIFAAKRGNKPLAVFLAPKADDGLELLQNNDVAGFRTPESCADAIHAYLNWRVPYEFPSVNLPRMVDIRQEIDDVKRFNEHTSLELFASLGIRRAESWVVRELNCVPKIQGNFAVKLLSPDVLHKTDVGMVKLNVAGNELHEVIRELLERASLDLPKAVIDGALVQRMEKGLTEVIIGYRHEPEVGPSVMLAMGGIMAELRPSLSVRLAPVTLATAREMIEEIPELKILSGYRNLPKGDINALANAVVAMSSISGLLGHPVAEAEINPLIVMGEHGGVVAVDGVVTLR